MKSTFTSTGMGYIYTLDDEVDDAFLTIEVSQLRSRGGSPLALLSTSSTIETARRIPGSDRVLNAEVWLLSDTSRGGYAASLGRSIPPPKGAAAIDFRAVLEEVAQRVIDAENAPVGVVRLDPHVKRKTTHFLLEGILPAGKPTILYGAGGVGKSILASAFAVAVQTGTQWMGRKVKQAEVLYLDWETDEDDIAGRIKAVSLGVNTLAEAPLIRYASLVRPVEDRVSQLARYVAEEKIELVIIDSVGMAMSSARDGSDASETAIRFFRALRGLNTAVLALDHVAGADMRTGRGSAKPYGSVYKWNSARNAFELREDREPDTKGSHLVLKHRKSNIGPRNPDLHFVMDWNGAQVIFASERVVTGPVTSLAERIADLLVVAPASPRQMSDLLSEGVDGGVSEMQVRLVLKGMLSEGSVTVMADGTVRKVDSPTDGGEQT